MITKEQTLSFFRDNWFKMAALVLIGVALWIAYVVMVVSPRNQRLEKAESNLSIILSRDSCLTDAQKSYYQNWADSCVSNADRVSAGYKSCLEQLNSAMCASIWGTPDSSPSCRLPQDAADTVNGYLATAKDDCYKMYPTSQ